MFGVIDRTQFSLIVGDIYDCVLEPPRWPETLARLASVMRSAASSVIINETCDHKRGRIFEHGVDQKYLRVFFERYRAADLRSAPEQARTTGS